MKSRSTRIFGAAVSALTILLGSTYLLCDRFLTPVEAKSSRGTFAAAGLISNVDAEHSQVRSKPSTPSTSIPAPKIANSLTLTVVLKRDDQPAFDRFVDMVQDPRSPIYHRYLSPAEQADTFGPSRQEYESTVRWLQRSHFTVIDGSANRLTLTVRGTRKAAEKAFSLREITDRMGRVHTDPKIPSAIANNVQAVVGFDGPNRPRASVEDHMYLGCETAAQVAAYQDLEYLACKQIAGSYCEALIPGIVARDYDICLDESWSGSGSGGNGPFGGGGLHFSGPTRTRTPKPPRDQAESIPHWGNADGSGQKVGLLEFDTFNINDVKDYLALAGQPASEIGRLSKVDVNGGATIGAEEAEVLIDIHAVMQNARGANVVVYDAPFNGIRTSFQTLFNRMISDGVTVISNSWVYCEDQTTAADVQSIDSVLASAAAAGITVLNSTGDFGSQCVDGSGNTISVPADSPHATAVGGTSLTLGPALTYSSETFWNGLGATPPTGAGGFGVSRFFARPSYQDGLVASPMRSVPDLSVNGDPAKGAEICQADAGGCPTGSKYGGTSLSAPVWAAFIAILNQAQGQNMGELNPKVYPLANTDAFHTASSMGSDFQHVGLGSPNLDLIYRSLTAKGVGAVDGAVSQITADPAGAVADGSSQAFVVVRLRDGEGNTVSGKTVSLTAAAGSHATITPASGVSNVANGAVIFSVTDTVPEVTTLTAADETEGVTLGHTADVAFVTPPAVAGSITAVPSTVTANGTDSTTITVTLQGAGGAPAPGKLIELSQGNGSSIISTSSAVTDAAGIAQFHAVSIKNEIVTYKAVDVTDQRLAVPGTASVEFTGSTGFCSQYGRYGIGQAAPGYAVTTFASNFAADCFANEGPIGLAFDGSQTLFVGDALNNNLYAFGQQGGTAGPSTLVGNVPVGAGVSLTGMVFTPDGRLYALIYYADELVELDPKTGAVLRIVAQNIAGGSPVGLAQDPISGDLFASGSDGVMRISNFSSGTAVVTRYAYGIFDGIVFAPDGTFYVVSTVGGIYKTSGSAAQPPVSGTLLVSLPGNPDGIAIEPNPSDPSKPVLFVNRNDGTITRIDTSLLSANGQDPCGAACTDIYTGGTRGDFVAVSAAGCLYATQSERVIKVTKADGTCSLIPNSTNPQLVLTPETVAPMPQQGGTVIFTAQLRNVASPADIPITLFASGANAVTKLVHSDATGKATFTYRGLFAGTDTAYATAVIGASTLVSNHSGVTWTDGKHGTFLTLNLSPSSGTANTPLTLTASLVDISVDPQTAIAGVPINFSIAGQSCGGTTDASGTASCTLNSGLDAGTYTLSSSFDGNAELVGSTDLKTVNIVANPLASPTPTPTPVPTATVSGRAFDPQGRGIRSVTVALTDGSGAVHTVLTSSLGFYSIDNIAIGQNVTIRATSKRYRFTRHTAAVTGDITVDLAGQE